MERAAGHEKTQAAKPTLYVVATPIGNLKDVTLRALEIFRHVDMIAAEDTRVTSRLLNHYNIDEKRLVALHEHNEQRTAPRIIAELESGRSVALASDAGTPAFSDPGARLVRAVREAGFAVVPVPGPNAAAAALSASGFDGPRFLFCGFLPAKPAERRHALEEIATLSYALVFYEAPHRVVEAMVDLAAHLGDSRRIVIARELTKLFESIHECALGEAAEWLAANPDRVKGEFVLIVEGAAPDADKYAAEAKRTLAILLEELPVKQAAALAAKITGARKNELYALALEMRQEREP
jgi:16S rRNA (cytidine1402-2'-O)-methyltransferase